MLKDIALCLTELAGKQIKETTEELQLRLYDRMAKAIQDGKETFTKMSLWLVLVYEVLEQKCDHTFAHSYSTM